MVIRDPAVVNRLDLSRRQQIRDRQPVAMQVEEFVANGEITGCRPCPSLALGAGESALGVCDLEGVPGR